MYVRASLGWRGVCACLVCRDRGVMAGRVGGEGVRDTHHLPEIELGLADGGRLADRR